MAAVLWVWLARERCIAALKEARLEIPLNFPSHSWLPSSPLRWVFLRRKQASTTLRDDRLKRWLTDWPSMANRRLRTPRPETRISPSIVTLLDHQRDLLPPLSTFSAYNPRASDNLIFSIMSNFASSNVIQFLIKDGNDWPEVLGKFHLRSWLVLPPSDILL